MNETLVAFSAESWREMYEEGGSNEWVLDPNRAGRCEYFVLERNSHYRSVWTPTYGVGDGPHNHLVFAGRNLKIIPMNRTNGKMRYNIAFAEYAILPTPIPRPWGMSQNPIRYFPTAQIPIDFESLPWKSFEDLPSEYGQSKMEEAQAEQPKTHEKFEYSTIELVQMLAKQLNKSPDVIMQKLLS